MEDIGSDEKDSSLSTGNASSQRDVLTAQVLLKKGKRHAAKYLRDECLRNLSPDESQAPRTQVRPKLLCTQNCS